MSDADKTRAEGLNYRALNGLLGRAARGPSGVVLEVIGLLRSDLPIVPEVREALAAALERGLYGYRTEQLNEEGWPMPWLEIGGMARNGRVGEAISVRRKWFDAAEELERRRAAGERGYSVLEAVGALHQLGVDGMKKANAFRNKFLDELAQPGSALVAETLNFWRVNKFEIENEDHYDFARALFIDREAEASCK